MLLLHVGILEKAGAILVIRSVSAYNDMTFAAIHRSPPRTSARRKGNSHEDYRHDGRTLRLAAPEADQQWQVHIRRRQPQSCPHLHRRGRHRRRLGRRDRVGPGQRPDDNAHRLLQAGRHRRGPLQLPPHLGKHVAAEAGRAARVVDARDQRDRHRSVGPDWQSGEPACLSASRRLSRQHPCLYRRRLLRGGQGAARTGRGDGREPGAGREGDQDEGGGRAHQRGRRARAGGARGNRAGDKAARRRQQRLHRARGNRAGAQDRKV